MVILDLLTQVLLTNGYKSGDICKKTGMKSGMEIGIHMSPYRHRRRVFCQQTKHVFATVRNVNMLAHGHGRFLLP